MKLAAFDYASPATMEEAVALFTLRSGNAKDHLRRASCRCSRLGSLRQSCWSI